jgi:Na+/H+ antiporter NhaD/arsenite permease-like protein
MLSLIVIAANAGGAWSVLGDLTTSMLWIGGQINPISIVLYTLLPAIAVVLVPLLLVRKLYPLQSDTSASDSIRVPYNNPILFIGMGALLIVPLINYQTGLPPYMAIMLVLGVFWIISQFIPTKERIKIPHRNLAAKALEHIDVASVLFFLGILLAISALQASGMLNRLAGIIMQGNHSMYLTGSLMGLSSSVIDNVPLVAAVQGMFGNTTILNGKGFWEFISLTTGTGGSILIIGSAAGIAVMGMEEIPFKWYLKNMSWIALIGFLAGIAVFLLPMLFGFVIP